MYNVMDTFSMKGKVVVVTGAAGNLGMHFAESFAQAGADLAVTDIPGTDARLADLAERLGKEYQVAAKPYIISRRRYIIPYMPKKFAFSVSICLFKVYDPL